MAESESKISKKSANRKGKSVPGGGGDSAKKSVMDGKKTPPKRRSRSDSDSIQGDIVAAALTCEIKPPAHIRFLKRDLPFWESVIREFAIIDWSDHALEVAALLARAMADLELEQYMMRREGSMIDIFSANKKDPKNKPVLLRRDVNSRKSLIELYSKNILAFRRSLMLHARGKDGEARDAGRRKSAALQKENNIRAVMADDDDGLINRPKSLN